MQLVTPTGEVYGGAEAVFRTLAYAPERRWMLGFYDRVPGARFVSEAAYRVVERHRGFFSRLTRLGWGRSPEPPTYILSRWVFLRLLGLVYVIAFVSLWGQLAGLVGAHGILPAGNFLQGAQRAYGADAYHLFPTLAWINSSDAGLKFLCGAGALAGLLVVLGVVTAPALALGWIFYLSLVTVGQDFLSFQWDILLLEIGFLAIILAPWRLLEPPWRPYNSGNSGNSPVSPTVLWLGRWLLFRLMFLSGAVKLRRAPRDGRLVAPGTQGALLPAGITARSVSNTEVSSIPWHLRDHLQPLLRLALSLAFASATVRYSMLEMLSEAPPQASAFL